MGSRVLGLRRARCQQTGIFLVLDQGSFWIDVGGGGGKAARAFCFFCNERLYMGPSI